MRRFIGKRTMRAAMALAIGIVLSCGSKDTPAPVQFTDDENYLIDAYVRVKRAGSYTIERPTLAESLYVYLGAVTDSVRIAQAVVTLNAAPDRWLDVFQEIENRMRIELKRRELEKTGS